MPGGFASPLGRLRDVAYSTENGRSTSRAPDAYARQFLQLLEEVWPGATAHNTGAATLSYPTGDAQVLGSYPVYTIGQLTSFGGYEPVPQGRIFFAGDHCAQGLTGFMERAARSGEQAARQIFAGLAGT